MRIVSLFPKVLLCFLPKFLLLELSRTPRYCQNLVVEKDDVPLRINQPTTLRLFRVCPNTSGISQTATAHKFCSMNPVSPSHIFYINNSENHKYYIFFLYSKYCNTAFLASYSQDHLITSSTITFHLLYSFCRLDKP